MPVLGIIVGGINLTALKLEEDKPEEPPAPSEEVALLTEIRDILRDK